MPKYAANVLQYDLQPTKAEDYQRCHDVPLKLGLPLFVPSIDNDIRLSLLDVVTAAHVYHPRT